MDDATPGRGSGRRSIPNGDRLAALGNAVNGTPTASVKPKTRKVRRHSGRFRVAVTAGIVVAVLLAFVGGGYLYAQWRFSQIKKISVGGETAALPGQPFNILEIGSDSRAGLTGIAAQETGANTGSVSGQRSDVIKIMHVDPATKSILVLSIPRDTVTTLLANQNIFGTTNRLNVNFGNGPTLLAKTITANFGIPINYTIVVSFGGLINAADAIGGVYLDFPYPAKDTYSGLRVSHAGCQLITGTQALAFVRSRHYEWYEWGQWNTDATSDFGRIVRQDNFIKAMINRAKAVDNPLKINSLLEKLPSGIELDQNLTLSDLVSLALKFRNFNSNDLGTYTLPVTSGYLARLGDIEYVEEPQAEQMLYYIFGKQLKLPTNPPPNAQGQFIMPTLPTTSTTPTTSATTSARVSETSSVRLLADVTTTSRPRVYSTPGDQWFDPVPCTP